MHDSWRMNAGQSGKRLKVLKVKGYPTIPNTFQDHMSELQVMAQSGDFLTVHKILCSALIPYKYICNHGHNNFT